MRDIRAIEERYRRRQESKGKIVLKKRYFIILILVVAFITNPNEEKHKDVMKSRVFEVVGSNSLFLENATDLLGYESNTVIDQLVDSYVSSDNYFLFSTTNVTWQGQTRTIGLGIFGNVFIPDKVDEMIKNYQE